MLPAGAEPWLGLHVLVGLEDVTTATHGPLAWKDLYVAGGSSRRVASMSRLSDGRSATAVSQTSSRSTPKYWWTRTLRIATMSRHGMRGCRSRNGSESAAAASPMRCMCGQPRPGSVRPAGTALARPADDPRSCRLLPGCPGAADGRLSHGHRLAKHVLSQLWSQGTLTDHIHLPAQQCLKFPHQGRVTQ